MEKKLKKKINSCEKIGHIFDYFWIFWFFGPIPKKSWKVFVCLVDIRTTNKCRNWNRSWKDLIGVQKQNFWAVPEKLTIQELESRVERFCRSEAPPKKKSVSWTSYEIYWSKRTLISTLIFLWRLIGMELLKFIEIIEKKNSTNLHLCIFFSFYWQYWLF